MKNEYFEKLNHYLVDSLITITTDNVYITGALIDGKPSPTFSVNEPSIMKSFFMEGCSHEKANHFANLLRNLFLDYGRYQLAFDKNYPIVCHSPQIKRCVVYSPSFPERKFKIYEISANKLPRKTVKINRNTIRVSFFNQMDKIAIINYRGADFVTEVNVQVNSIYHNPYLYKDLNKPKNRPAIIYIKTLTGGSEKGLVENQEIYTYVLESKK